MKYYKKKDGVISNTKFYNLKTCVLNSLIAHPLYYDISVEKVAICEDMLGKQLVSLSIYYKGCEYKFHQPIENVYRSFVYSQATHNGSCGLLSQWPMIEYEKDTNIPEENWGRFNDGIEYIKWWVWDNYKYTLGNINLFVNKPCQYLNLLSYIKPNIVIKINRNGAFTNDYNGSQIGYSANVQLFDGKWMVKCGSLKEIRKNLKYLIYVNESKRNFRNN
jgi:hypothetical protein